MWTGQQNHWLTQTLLKTLPCRTPLKAVTIEVFWSAWIKYQLIFIVRNSSCGEVMFSQLLSWGGMHGGGHVWWGGPCVAGLACVVGAMRGRRDGHCSGRCASYWSVFLYFDEYYLTRLELESLGTKINYSWIQKVRETRVNFLWDLAMRRASKV